MNKYSSKAALHAYAFYVKQENNKKMAARAKEYSAVLEAKRNQILDFNFSISTEIDINSNELPEL